MAAVICLTIFSVKLELLFGKEPRAKLEAWLRYSNNKVDYRNNFNDNENIPDVRYLTPSGTASAGGQLAISSLSGAVSSSAGTEQIHVQYQTRDGRPLTVEKWPGNDYRVINIRTGETQDEPILW